MGMCLLGDKVLFLIFLFDALIFYVLLFSKLFQLFLFLWSLHVQKSALK